MRTFTLFLTIFWSLNFSFSQCYISDDDPTYYAKLNTYIYQNKSTDSAIKKEIPKGSSVRITNSFFGELGWWEVCFQNIKGWVKKTNLSYKAISTNNIGFIKNKPASHSTYLFEGKIANKYNIQMSFEINDNLINGYYFYTNKGGRLKLSGRLDSQKIILNEFDSKGNLTGDFYGEFDYNKNIKGKWSKPDRSSEMSFFLKRVSNIKQGNNQWLKIDIGNWGGIELPNSMEIQSGIYKKVMDYSKRHFSLNADRVVFQQKGVNNGENLDTYSRVIIRTDYSTNDLPDFNTTEITASDIDYLNNIYKKELTNAKNGSKFPFKIIKWNNAKIITLNGNKCINYSYIRQLNGKPQTYTEFFTFWKGNKQHTLNVEYRLNDKDKWKSDIDKCVKTFVIKN